MGFLTMIQNSEACNKHPTWQKINHKPSYKKNDKTGDNSCSSFHKGLTPHSYL